MPLTFKPFHIWFNTHHSTKERMDFINETKFAPQTASKVWNDRFPVKSDVIERICETYNLKIEEVCEYREDKQHE
ncbi:helix-turn-helix domain-containing protein [Hazenella sp. IB182353]|nr:helix-turn-helix domain-containing protein [Polycladospora coralii]